MKMNIKYQRILLALIFLITFLFRLYFALKTPYFSDDKSYFFLRQMETIRETGKPLIEDQLSYGGRRYLFLPMYPYFLAVFSLFTPPVLAGKIIPNLLISTSVIAAYLIAYEITKNKNISLTVAFISGFIPVNLLETINSINLYSVALPGTFFLIYFFIRLEKENRFINFILLFLFILVLSTPLSYLLVFSFLIYLIICYIEKLKISKKEIEIILFSIFFTLWANFLIFKKAFLEHGFRVIWQNIPTTQLDKYFSQIGITEAIYAMGIIPLVFGLITIYNHLFKVRSKSMYILISVCISAFLLSWFKLINFIAALIFLSQTLVILSGMFMKDFLIYFRKTKFSGYEKILILVFFVIIILTSIVPSIGYANEAIANSFTKEDIEPFEWIRENTPNDSVILTTVSEGNLLTYYGERKDVADSNYLMITNIDTRVNDIEAIYTTGYKINALELLLKYDVDYILLSRIAERTYNITGLGYVDDTCFTLVYNETSRIYLLNCKLEKK